MNDLKEIAELLPPYKTEILNIPEIYKERITDIKICVGSNPVAYMNKDVYIINGCAPTSKEAMLDIVHAFCDYSVYKHIEEIKQGFISVKNKFRVGICGTAVINNGGIDNVKNITSITIRVSGNHINGATDLLNKVRDVSRGVLIVGEPSSGKTTILKDLINRLSSKKITVLDERYELMNGIRGKNISVLYGYPKTVAINQSIRNLGNELIICDELEEKDTDAVKLCAGSGVAIISTVHGKNIEHNMRKLIKILISTYAFEYVVELEGRHNPSKVKKVWEVGELLEDNRFKLCDDCIHINRYQQNKCFKSQN